MEGMNTVIAALRSAIAAKERTLESDLIEIGIIHREYLAGKDGGCPCTVPGSKERCIMADLIERGMEEITGQAMPTPAGSSSN